MFQHVGKRSLAVGGACEVDRRAGHVHHEGGVSIKPYGFGVWIESRFNQYRAFF
jgi:hypothetical protein